MRRGLRGVGLVTEDTEKTGLVRLHAGVNTQRDQGAHVKEEAL